MATKSAWHIFFLVVILLAFDRLSKTLALQLPGEGVLVFPGFKLLSELNPYLAFGFKANQNLIIALLVLLAAALVIIAWTETKKQNNRRLILGLGFLIAGALSNLFDRIVLDGVIDFLYITGLSNFNLSDLYITIGIILILLPKKKG